MVYCLKLLQDFDYINRFSIFAHRYIHTQNNILLMPKDGLILKKIIKFFKLLKRRIDIHNAETELKFILENK